MLTLSDYRALAELRYQIRSFAHFSEQASRAAGLEPRQHQLMLTLKGLPEGVRPRIRELAKRLRIQHHSAVELVDRLAGRKLVTRSRAPADRRQVLIHLTELSEAELEKRRAAWQPRGSAFASGYIWKYAQQVGSARHGAVTHPGGAAEKACYADI